MIKRFLNIYRFYIWSHHKYAKHIGVKFGKGCRIRTKFFGSEPYLIEIGDWVQITTGVRFLTHGGGWTLREKYPNFDCFGKIKIGNNVYIGINSIILPGVIIGNDVIIGAGSVVTKSVLSGTIVAGNPAKVIGDMSSYEKKILPYNLNSKLYDPVYKKKFLMSLSEDKFIIK